MAVNDTDARQIDLFGTFEPRISATARTAVHRVVRTLATAKNYRSYDDTHVARLRFVMRSRKSTG